MAAPIIVGVCRGQSPAVAAEAARLAGALGAELVCAFVNVARYVVTEDDDGNVTTASLDPDFDDSEEEFPPEVAAALQSLLAPTGVSWRPVLLGGTVADALAGLAAAVSASMIVVGTHNDAHGGNMREFFRHSVANALARRQQLPVHVVPTHGHAAHAGHGSGGGDLPPADRG
ncbi:universal stress protein [Specibacter cremeus]|uniref:universal stress protein n=1 Tax=Specibacter cremeus TaxID=1629051 RepID=UPI0013DE416E|nr:universal stress protein [Specibacter cremeus]